MPSQEQISQLRTTRCISVVMHYPTVTINNWPQTLF